MGPIALFDKSFLQSLNLNESVFFDHFFLAVICPIFYVETLADLEKAVRQGRTPEREVGIIASKTPELHSGICANHLSMCISDFFGDSVPMDGRIPVAGGRHVKVEGQSGLVYEESPEEKALGRWLAGKFLEVERGFAKIWRNAINAVDLSAAEAGIRAMGINPQTCKSLEEAKQIADTFVQSTDAPRDRLNLAAFILSIPPHLEDEIYERWQRAGFPPLTEFAPYAAHVLGVAVFFNIAVGAKLLSKADRMDISYLFYLPFCMVFVSSDKLHRRIAPLFLRPDQEFVWGLDLKTDLQRIVKFFSLPESEREKGIFALAPTPPTEREGLVTGLWDRHLGPWRDRSQRSPERDPTEDHELIEHIKTVTGAPAIPTDEVPPDSENISMVSIQRRIRRKKGSFWQVPKDLKE